MASNTNIQLADLDFADIKSNFITFLQGQNILKDYDYTGSGLSTLLDILAYYTQYNAYYLNMVANEMFLDSAIQRESVVSHAKLLGYTPQSAIAPTAIINMNVYNVTASSLTLPQYTKFISESIDGVNYTFLTTDAITVNTNNTTQIVTFEDVEIKQAVVGTNQFTVDISANPTLTFEIPDTNIDTSTLTVTVQDSVANTYYDVYTLATDYTNLTSTSKVFFLQEGIRGFYEIYFGDGIVGQTLEDGNLVNVSYLSTKGLAAEGANSFTLLDTIGGFGVTDITPILSATKGKNRETIDSIRFQAPKSYATNSRAVSKDDYITIIQQNKYGISLDAVNVWGGEEADPPVYGKIYVSIKPSGGYSLTEEQKNIIINDVIKPVSVMTVTPEIISPDYLYLLLTASVTFDSRKTNRTASQIQDLIKSGVATFCQNTLNTFNATFSVGDLIVYTQALDRAIIGIDFDVTLQRRILPELINAKTYSVEFNNALRKYANQSVIFPISFGQYDINANFYSQVFFEERNDVSTGLDSVILLNGGSGYSSSPVVTIYGDGVGATAIADVLNGVITGITVTSAGRNYTQALVTITDTSGINASATAILKENYTGLRTYYFQNSIKNVLTQDAGSIDYVNGIVTLTDFQPYTVNSVDGYFRINALAEDRIVASSFNKIITLDSSDPTAIVVNVTTI
jgi:hypothetical protein